MIYWYALFGCRSNMSAYVYLSCSYIVVLAVVPHFELAKFFKRLLRVATFAITHAHITHMIKTAQ